MGWPSIRIRDDQKDMLDELKNEVRKETGQDPSYSDIIDELAGDLKRDRSSSSERDFMEIF